MTIKWELSDDKLVMTITKEGFVEGVKACGYKFIPGKEDAAWKFFCISEKEITEEHQFVDDLVDYLAEEGLYIVPDEE